jgi:hypothetical protein
MKRLTLHCPASSLDRFIAVTTLGIQAGILMLWKQAQQEVRKGGHSQF